MIDVLLKSKGWVQNQIERLPRRLLWTAGLILVLLTTFLVWQSSGLEKSEQVAVQFYKKLWDKRDFDSAMDMVSDDAQKLGKGSAEAQIYLSKSENWSRPKTLQISPHPFGKQTEDHRSYVLFSQPFERSERIYEVTIKRKNNGKLQGLIVFQFQAIKQSK